MGKKAALQQEPPSQTFRESTALFSIVFLIKWIYRQQGSLQDTKLGWNGRVTSGMFFFKKVSIGNVQSDVPPKRRNVYFTMRLS